MVDTEALVGLAAGGGRGEKVTGEEVGVTGPLLCGAAAAFTLRCTGAEAGTDGAGVAELAALLDDEAADACGAGLG
jgi:hypothetical protein